MGALARHRLEEVVGEGFWLVELKGRVGRGERLAYRVQRCSAGGDAFQDRTAIGFFLHGGSEGPYLELFS